MEQNDNVDMEKKKVEYSNEKLFGKVFSNLEIDEFEISDSYLKDLDFENCKIFGFLNFESVFIDCNFREISISSGFCSGVIFKNCQFMNVRMLGSVFSCCYFLDCDFKAVFFGKDDISHRSSFMDTSFINCGFREIKSDELTLSGENILPDGVFELGVHGHASR